MADRAKQGVTILVVRAVRVVTEVLILVSIVWWAAH